MAACLSVAEAHSQKVIHSPFKHYTERVAQFETEEPIDSADIVMLGNSLTESGGDWGKLLGVDNIVNRGISGDDAKGISHRLVQILPGKPKAIFLMVGINDLSHGLSPQQVAQEAVAVMSIIRQVSPSTRLYVQSLLPVDTSKGKWQRLSGKDSDIPTVNALLSDYCRANGITYIDLYSKFVRHGTYAMRRELTVDGLHLTRQGYKLWAFELRRYLQDLIAD